MSDPPYPTPAPETLDGWTLTEESVETVFQLSGMRVRAATRRYEDEPTREAVERATDGTLDHQWRFLSASRLGFVPPLPPGPSRSMVLPQIKRQAGTAFADRLEERGLAEISRRRSERIRLGDRTRAYLYRYDALDPVLAEPLPVTGWVGVWHADGSFFVVTGGYPGVTLANRIEVADPPDLLCRSTEAYREAFFEFLRGVS